MLGPSLDMKKFKILEHLLYYSYQSLIRKMLVGVFVFNIPPTVKVTSRHGNSLNSHSTDW